MRVRAAFLGNDPWSVPTLEALAGDEHVEVVLVVTNPPRPAGRGSRPTPTAVAGAARRLGLPLLEVDGFRHRVGIDALVAARPDALVVVAYGEILTSDVLAVAPLGALNVHFSTLPRWRGAAPVQRALLAGDETTGVTVMLMDEGLDTGPILANEEVEIRTDDDAGSLGERLATIGAPLLVGAVRSLSEGAVDPRPQDGRLATRAPKITADERSIAWAEPASAIVRRVRALAPEPSASARVRGTSLKVFRAEVAAHAPGGAPGEVVSVDREGIVVAAASGAVRLLEVAAPGRRRMSAAAWARGARIAPGDTLG